jgi:hypothetical protein
MKTTFNRRRIFLGLCALAIGLGASWSAFARPCCSSCGDFDPGDPTSVRCWAICDFNC